MTSTTPTLNDLMAKVGYFVFYWGLFETALVDAIRSYAGDAREIPPSVLGRLKLWRRLVPSGTQEAATIANEVYKQARKLREIRNLIVHGIVHAQSYPGTPYVECASLTGKKRKYTIDELEHFVQSIDACRRAFDRLGHFNYRLNDREAAQ